MKILITNHAMVERAGTEMYVYDIATSLQKMGHRPYVFTPEIGALGYRLHAASIPVVDTLENTSFVPDVIHGHHHLPCLTALTHFPDVPAVYFCHGWSPQEEAALKFPRILRYVAISETCLDRLIVEGIPEEKIEQLLNFVDIEKFLPRPPLPEKPKRVLIFSNKATENFIVPPIKKACLDLELELDVIGSGVNNPTETPEKVLSQYDIVFAVGKSALEALAVGCAVILCDAGNIGPLVTTSNYDHCRKMNFAYRTLLKPLTIETALNEIRSYDCQEAARVSAIVRDTACKKRTINSLLSLYQGVIDEYKTAKEKMDIRHDLKAVSQYLCHQYAQARRSSIMRLSEEMIHHTKHFEILGAKCDWLIKNNGRQSLTRLILSKIYHLLCHIFQR